MNVISCTLLTSSRTGLHTAAASTHLSWATAASPEASRSSSPSTTELKHGNTLQILFFFLISLSFNSIHKHRFSFWNI